MAEARLPAGFADLAPFAERWGKASENERNAVRWNASAADFSALYEAMMPRLDEILAILSDRPAPELAEEEQRLFLLACAFAEASPHHELYRGSAEVPFSFDARRFVPAHGDVDSAG